jgi:NADPH:quinone reductase-like Zn-dependent oxidoreductase
MTFRTIITAAAALGLAATLAMPATAGDGRYRDKVYADSFGNLVVYSAAGYKRIIVGQGHLAEEVRDFTGGDEPDVVYYEDSGRHHMSRCPDAVLLKGRSYMYGLPDGVVPQPACR